MQNGANHSNLDRTTMVHESDEQKPDPRASNVKVEKKEANRKKKTDFLALFGGLLFIVALAVAAVFGVIFIQGSKDKANQDLSNTTNQLAQTTVLVTNPEVGNPDLALVLPGSVQAVRETPIYARVSGYLKDWKVDIGSHVTEGQLLAEIETPETDQQLLQSEATKAQAQANLQLSQVNAQRYNELLKGAAVAKSEADNANADLAAKQADLEAAQAGVDRLKQIQSFKLVYAPFTGVITERRVEVGNLINAGAGTPAQELFSIAETDVLRIFVNVPERYCSLMVPGLTAQIDMASNPGHPVTGVLTKTSGAIDQASLTMLVELDVQNSSMELLPGGYAQVHFALKDPHPPLLIPGNCLIFRSDGPQLAIADENDHKVHIKSVKLGKDLGTKLEVLSGLDAQDEVVVNPPDSLVDGKDVQIKKMEKPSPAAGH